MIRKGLKRLSKESGVPLAGMLFVGDAIYPGGNDYPAAEIGVDTVTCPVRTYVPSLTRTVC